VHFIGLFTGVAFLNNAIEGACKKMTDKQILDGLSYFD